MKKNTFLAALLFAAGVAALAGCRKEGESYSGLDTLTVSGTLGADLSDVASVEAVADNNSVLAKGAMTGRDFTMTLRSPLPATALTTDYADIIDGLTVITSDTSATAVKVKGTRLHVMGYVSGGSYGSVLVKSKTAQRTSATELYIYVDGDVTLTCDDVIEDDTLGQLTAKINLALQKGWNVVVVTRSEGKDGATVQAAKGSLGGVAWSSGNSL